MSDTGDSWLQIYRGYTDEELASEITWLKVQARNPFSVQSEGARSVTRSTSEMRDRLAAATQVTNERGGADRGLRHMVPDFSNFQP
jgi:hypothetical protein